MAASFSRCRWRTALRPRLCRFYLFEFCDQTWIPSSARECLFEIMELCNSGVRSFNARVAGRVIRIAQDNGYREIVELGAGRAPITSLLAKNPQSENLTLIPCDVTPNIAVFRSLEEQYPGKVRPIYESVDITQRNPLLDGKVLVMAGMLHHIPHDLRADVLRALSCTASRSIIFEPLKRTLCSMLLTLFSFFPAVALPVANWRRPGRFRRLLWCWLLPIVPLMFVWDGIVSCLRQWTADEYLAVIKELGSPAHDLRLIDNIHSLELEWSGMATPASSKPNTLHRWPSVDVTGDGCDPL